MPYRRLPNTNLARLRCLEAAVAQGNKVVDIQSLPFSTKTLEDSRDMLVKYSRLLDEYKQCANTRIKNHTKYADALKMARLYVSHFIQVVNMCVLRGEIKSELKQLYGLEPKNSNVPDLSTDQYVLEWGERVLEGEQKRQMKGGTPIYNPSIAKVRVFYENFVDAEKNQRVLEANTLRKMEEVTKINPEVDAIILKMWDEVESHFANLPEAEKMERCIECGVIYYYRRAEKRKLAAAQAAADQQE